MRSQNLSFKKSQWSEPFQKDLDSENSIIFCFYDSRIDWQVALDEIKGAFPKSKIVGCSSAGEIVDTQVNSESFVAQVTRFEKTKIRIASIQIESPESSFDVGAKLGKELASSDLKALVVLSDGLGVNGTQLSRGIGSGLSDEYKDVVVSGGLAGDGSRFEKTSILCDSKFLTGWVLAVGFYGQNLSIGTGSFGGWDAFGPKRKVTKSTGNILFELDNQPALALYKTYLGDQISGLPGSALLFPLSISHANRHDVVRTVLSVDENSQSMTFAGDVPEGSSAQLMRANFTHLIHAAGVAGLTAVNSMLPNSSPSITIAISCVGRRLVLGQRIEDETEALAKALPSSSKVIGFYSYGELSPAEQQQCELHNQTMTITIMQET